MDTKRGFKGHAEPPFKEKIKELIENGTLKKSREVPHAKAVAKSFEKPCAKSKFTILITMSDHDSEDKESLPNSQSPVKASMEKLVQVSGQPPQVVCLIPSSSHRYWIIFPTLSLTLSLSWIIKVAQEEGIKFVVAEEEVGDHHHHVLETTVWWDLNTCPVPAGVDPRCVRACIESALEKQIGRRSAVSISMLLET
uniref:NYN domain-containing protein n=1 Tax=Brassica oleracea var. oleracea TaxID=109376 RepID=A0A0D3A186_BRAOL